VCKFILCFIYIYIVCVGVWVCVCVEARYDALRDELTMEKKNALELASELTTALSRESVHSSAYVERERER
jgi:hypothetical protein